MKVTCDFKPVTLNITFDTRQEMACFYAMFNHASLTHMCDSAGLDTDKLRNVLRPAVGTSYRNYHKQLCEVIK